MLEKVKPWLTTVIIQIVVTACTVPLFFFWWTDAAKRHTETAAQVSAVRANVAEWVVEINDERPVMIFRFKTRQEVSDELYREKTAMEKAFNGGNGKGLVTGSYPALVEARTASAGGGGGGAGSSIVYRIRCVNCKTECTSMEMYGGTKCHKCGATLLRTEIDKDFIGPLEKPAELLEEPGR